MRRWVCPLGCLVLALASSATLAGGAMPPEVRAAADELWRRGLCVLSSIVLPARRASIVPPNLGTTPILDGRQITRRGRFACYARQGDFLWVATDTALTKVSMTTGAVVATFTPADGLPDAPIDDLVADGALLWVVSRAGVAALDVARGRFLPSSGWPRFRLARLAVGPRAVWVVAENGTFAYLRSTRRWLTLPPAPFAAAAAAQLDRGIWRLRWRSATRRTIEKAAVAGNSLYALGMGTLARLDRAQALDGKARWQTVSRDAWAIAADGPDLWVLTTRGVERHAPDGLTRYSTADGLPPGRLRAIVPTKEAVWVAAEPQVRGNPPQVVGGGLARFDRATGKWQAIASVNGLSARYVTWLEAGPDGSLWAASQLYDKLVTLSAHPGMMHVRRQVPEVTALAIYHYLPQAGRWESATMPLPRGQERYILGQRNTWRKGWAAPRAIVAAAATPRAICCIYQMFPRGFYGGYFHSVGLLARREGGRWRGAYEDFGPQVGLAGEQPAVMLVSESHGKRIVYAEGQPRALGLWADRGGFWVVTERAVARSDPDARHWRLVAATRSRYYWQPTAACADARSLWLGCDAGVVSRLEKATLRCEPLAWFPQRKVVALALDTKGRLWVRTAPGKAVLPSDLRTLPQVRVGDVAVLDSGAWRKPRPGETFPRPSPKPTIWQFRKNILWSKDPKTGRQRPVAFLRGVFRPAVLCQDGQTLWVRAYEALIRLDLREAAQ